MRVQGVEMRIYLTDHVMCIKYCVRLKFSHCENQLSSFNYSYCTLVFNRFVIQQKTFLSWLSVHSRFYIKLFYSFFSI